ncbi:surfactant-associated protein 2 isoform X2 [Arvicanthis niloticus]|uniref:surfactant-associated protein 2 isoform X2 n=1 Tax=Arvicanthis niloticus TaxID=61156 RepID=UPI00402BD912
MSSQLWDSRGNYLHICFEPGPEISPTWTPASLKILERERSPLLSLKLVYLKTHQKRASDPTTDGCEPPWGCWELNSGSLEEQSVLLTFEPNNLSSPHLPSQRTDMSVSSAEGGIFACLCVCTPPLCSSSKGQNREFEPWDWSYRCGCWELKPGPFGGADEGRRAWHQGFSQVTPGKEQRPDFEQCLLSHEVYSTWETSGRRLPTSFWSGPRGITEQICLLLRLPSGTNVTLHHKGPPLHHLTCGA